MSVKCSAEWREDDGELARCELEEGHAGVHRYRNVLPSPAPAHVPTLIEMFGELDALASRWLVRGASPLLVLDAIAPMLALLDVSRDEFVASSFRILLADIPAETLARIAAESPQLTAEQVKQVARRRAVVELLEGASKR